jgi:hypothetical protein
VLPGSKPDEVYLQMQSKREDAFWVEVDQKQAEYQISRQEAIILVSDYMPRAESEQQLPDPTIDNS